MNWNEVTEWFNEHQGVFAGAGVVVGIIGAIDSHAQRNEIRDLLVKVLQRIDMMERRILDQLKVLQLEDAAGKLRGANIALTTYSSLDIDNKNSNELAKEIIVQLTNDLAVFVIGPLIEQIDSTGNSNDLTRMLDAYVPLIIAAEMRQFCLLELNTLFAADTRLAIAKMYTNLDRAGEFVARRLRAQLREEFNFEIRDGEAFGRGLPPEKMYGYQFNDRFFLVESLLPPFTQSEIEEARNLVRGAIQRRATQLYSAEAAEFIAVKESIAFRASEYPAEEGIEIENSLLESIEL